MESSELDARKQENEKSNLLKKSLLKQEKLDVLRKIDIFAYSVGHFFNDLIGSLYFNYYLYFVVDIAGLSSGLGGATLFIGQATDTITTPILGYVSDKTDTKIGKRKPWYLAGFVLQIISIIGLYQKCPWCEGSAEIFKFLYYALMIFLLNVAYSFVQVNHMSLVPSLTHDGNTRNKLVGYVNFATYAANSFVLLVSFVFIKSVNDPMKQFNFISIVCAGVGICTNLIFIFVINEVKLTKGADEMKNQRDTNASMLTLSKSQVRLDIEKLKQSEELKKQGKYLQAQQKSKQLEQVEEEEDQDQLLNQKKLETEDQFQMDQEKSKRRKSSSNKKAKVPETFLSRHSSLSQANAKLLEQEQEKEGKNQQKNKRLWLENFKSKNYWLCAMIYMNARLANNLAMAMLPFYLIHCLNVGGVTNSDDAKDQTPWQLSIVPMIMYFGSSCAALFMKTLAQKLSKKIVYGIGTVIVVASLFPYAFLYASSYEWIFGLCFCLGFGISTQLATAMTLIADFVGSKGKQGASVYAQFALFDKILSGIILLVITNLSYFKDENVFFSRLMMVVLPMFTSINGFIAAMFAKIRKYGEEEAEEENENGQNEQLSIDRDEKERSSKEQKQQGKTYQKINDSDENNKQGDKKL